MVLELKREQECRKLRLELNTRKLACEKKEERNAVNSNLPPVNSDLPPRR